jgi:3-deoxy-7-phosphoheptulonate synthase
MVDCSHDNSGKNHELQAVAFQDVLDQRLRGRGSLIGAMIESNLGPGSQPAPRAGGALRYGVSITDACMDWPATEHLIRAAHAALPATVAATV